MTRTRIRWLEIGLIVVAAVGGIVAVLAGVPGLIDVEGYKPGLIEAVREATGRELVIDGPMRVRMFPVPGVGAGTVRFANAVGAKGAQMIDVRWVAVRPSWSALLHGKVEVGTLTLYQPTIVLETDANGIPNWEFGPGENAKQAAGAPSGGFHLAVGRLQIVRGTITYTNPRTKAVFRAEDVNAGATVRSFDGPFEIDGEGTVNGVPLKIDAAMGENTPAGHSARLNLKVSSGELDFKGGIAALQLDTKIQGHLSMKTGTLSDFVTSVFSAIGAAKPAFDTSGAGRFSFEGDIDTGPDHLAATNFDMSMGKDEATGSVKLTLGANPALDGKLSLTRLDIGKWVTILSRPIEFTPDPVKAVSTAPTAEVAAAKAATAVVGPSPWSKIDADLSLQIAEAIYNNDTIRDLSATFAMRKGVATVPQLKAALPGGMTIDVDAAKGTLKAAAPHLRETLRWLGVDITGVPAGRLEKLAIDGKLATKAGALDMSDGTFRLDDVPGTMAGTLSLKVPPSASLNIGMEKFNLDDYIPKSRATADPDSPPPAVTTPTAKMPADLPKDAASLGLKLDIRNLVYRGQTMAGVTGGVTLTSDLLKLQDLRVANLLGAKLGLSGLVADYGAAPRFDLSFTVAAPDTDKLLDYAGLPKFMNGTIGPGTASGAVAGTREAVTLRDVAVHALDTDARIAGTLGFADPVPFDFRTFNLQTADAGKFVSVASGHATGSLGPLAATGALKGSSDRAAFTGDLAIRGSNMNGTLDATLGKRPKLVAKLNVPKTLDVDALLGIEDDSAPAPLSPDEAPSEVRHTRPARKATPKPINLTAIRSFDATLIVSAKAMSMAALTVDYADLDATLANGVFRINKLTGQFYKGAVDFTGTIDASGQALGVEANGTLLGIHLDELLLGTVGTNAFGQSYRVTVDGKLDARGIKLTGKGVSAAELRESLSTATTVSGTVRASMAGGAQSFAQFATGIGSIFSDTLAFDRAILSGFINNENAVSGGVVLGGGALTLQDQAVRGNGATAVISGRNHFADDTTDTTVTVANGSRQYVARITGKLSSPNIAADSK
jgi:uncharacterized protein involved in outer membrane biogenesis